MTSASAAESDPPPHIRNPGFRDWVNRVVAEGQGQGLTIGQIADRGGISHGQLNRWRGIGGAQSIPEAGNLVRFCLANGLDIGEPYRILGWGEPVGLPVVDSRVREAIVALVEVIEAPGVDRIDRDEALAQLEFIADRLRIRADRRGERSE